MLTARASDGDSQVVPVGCLVAGEPFFDEVCDVCNHFVDSRLFLHVLDNRRILACQRALLRIVVGVGQISDVKHKVGGDGDAVFIAERFKR